MKNSELYEKIWFQSAILDPTIMWQIQQNMSSSQVDKNTNS
jgi:hypothetical protein